jgi:hypothetical protein
MTIPGGSVVGRSCDKDELGKQRQMTQIRNICTDPDPSIDQPKDFKNTDFNSFATSLARVNL